LTAPTRIAVIPYPIASDFAYFPSFWLGEPNVICKVRVFIRPMLTSVRMLGITVIGADVRRLGT
jgi:hypothetical protein